MTENTVPAPVPTPGSAELDQVNEEGRPIRSAVLGGRAAGLLALAEGLQVGPSVEGLFDAVPTPGSALPPEPPRGVQVQVSRGRPSFPCSCGRSLGPNDARPLFKANPGGVNVYVFTCSCGSGHIVESRERLTVAEPPVGEERNSRCRCGSGRKAKKCHPSGFVPEPGAHDKRP